MTESDKMPEGKRADSSLREKERKVQSLQMQGITGSKLTVLELVERYLSLKTGVKHNTLANYNFVVNVLKKEEFSHKKVDDIKLSDAKKELARLKEAKKELDKNRFVTQKHAQITHESLIS